MYPFVCRDIFDDFFQAIFCPFLVKSKRGQDDDDDKWLEDDKDNELDEEERELVEEFMNEDQEQEEEMTLEELLATIDNLAELEEEDSNLGRNAVMKVN